MVLKHEEQLSAQSLPETQAGVGKRRQGEHPGPWEGRVFKASSSSGSGLPAALPLLCGCKGLWPEAESFPNDGPFENKGSSSVSLKGSDGWSRLGIFSKNASTSRSGTGVSSS